MIDKTHPLMDRSRRWARNLLVDVTPLRESVRFRWLFAGLGVTWLGRQFTVVAVPYQVYQLTGSTLAVGALGLVQFLPTLFISLAGGAVADAVDRRSLMTWMQVGLALTATGMAANTLIETPLVWPLFVLAGINAGLTAVDLPTRAASIPTLVGKPLLPSALALNHTLGNVSKAVGPALAGLLIARTSLTFTFAMDAAAFVIGAVMMLRIGPLPPEGGGTRASWRSIAEGLRFLRERRILQAAFAIDLNAMVFGMPTALFPAIGTALLGGGASTVGILYAAPGLGALLAALTSGWIGSVRRHGRGVIAAVLVWGVGITLFGLMSSLGWAVAFLAIAGSADVISAVLRQTILQTSVPDSLRGRLSGVNIAVVGGGPRLGDLEAGAVAAFTSVRFSVVSGGVACIIGALVIARLMPELAAHHVYDEPQTE